MSQPLDIFTLPLQGIQLIEASAGTGKTWSIASLYVRLVLGHGVFTDPLRRPLLPREILVVTFTKAATEELKDRIRSRLNETAEYLRHPDPSLNDALLERLLEAYPDAAEREAAAYRLHLAAESMDEAAISTIHGWCQRMLKQHAFDSGALFDETLAEDHQALLQACARDFWRSEIQSLDPDRIAPLLGSIASPMTLCQAIGPLLRIPGETLEALIQQSPLELTDLKTALDAYWNWSHSFASNESLARSAWKDHRSQIEAILRSAYQDQILKRDQYKLLDTKLQQMAEWADRGGPLDPKVKMERFARNRFVLAQEGGAEPSHYAFDLLGMYLDEMARTDLMEGLKTALVLTATLKIQKQYARIKHERAVLDQNDFIQKLHQALAHEGGEQLARVIRQQYPVALIDEFQDTDPFQYQIFKTIYGESTDQAAWLMVGDPKQAIYGFRGADIFSYLDARDQPGVNTHTLPTNYRSTEPLVAAINQIFQQGETHPEGAFAFSKHPSGQPRLPFERVSAKGLTTQLLKDGEPLPALTLQYLSHGGMPIGKDAFKLEMAKVCANTIAELLNQSTDPHSPELNAIFFLDTESQKARNLKPSDMAVLVRDRHEADAIKKQLAARGLKSVYLSDGDSVFKTSEAQDLLIWMDAFLNPREGARLRAALSTPMLAHRYDAIEQLILDETQFEATVERFVGYSEIWQADGILPAVRRFILDERLPHRIIGQPGYERTLTNLFHLTELLQSESQSLDGQNGLIRFLRSAIDDESKQDEHILRLEDDSGLIRILTLFKSKGLEFPLVFLPFIADSKGFKTPLVYAYHDSQNRLELSLSPGDPGDPNSPFERMKREQLQEALRLFYVGLTRAQYGLWMGVAPVKSRAGQQPLTDLHQGALGYLLKGGDEIRVDELGPLLEQLIHGLPETVLHEVVSEPKVNYWGRLSQNTLTRTPRRYEGGPFERWSIESYSRMIVGLEHEDPAPTLMIADLETGADDRADEARILSDIPESTAATQGLHAFPAGKAHGDYLHGLLEAAGNAGFDRVLTDPMLRKDLVTQSLRTRTYPESWADRLDHWLEAFLAQNFPLQQSTLRLGDLPKEAIRSEMEFWFEIEDTTLEAIDQTITRHILPGQERPRLKNQSINGMLKGFMDLCFRHEGRYYIADYKSNRLGTQDADYTPERLNQEILHHRYDLQYTLYLLALHRYLKSRLKEQYDYEHQIGGVAYFFLRGLGGPSHGIHFIKPPFELIETLDRMFRKGTPGDADGH